MRIGEMGPEDNGGDPWNEQWEEARTERQEKQAMDTNAIAIAATTYPNAARGSMSATATGDAVSMGNATIVGGTATLGDIAAMGETIPEETATTGTVTAATDAHVKGRHQPKVRFRN